MRKSVLFIFFSGFFLHGMAAEKRDLLQKEARRINLAQLLVQNFSELDFPRYSNRGFWDNLPSAIMDIECCDVEDNGLKRFWPKGITRIVFTMHSTGKKGESTIKITPL